MQAKTFIAYIQTRQDKQKRVSTTKTVQDIYRVHILLLCNQFEYSYDKHDQAYVCKRGWGDL